jgi:hypothetical protein
MDDITFYPDPDNPKITRVARTPAEKPTMVVKNPDGSVLEDKAAARAISGSGAGHPVTGSGSSPWRPLPHEQGGGGSEPIDPGMEKDYRQSMSRFMGQRAYRDMGAPDRRREP